MQHVKRMGLPDSRHVRICPLHVACAQLPAAGGTFVIAQLFTPIVYPSLRGVKLAPLPGMEQHDTHWPLQCLSPASPEPPQPCDGPCRHAPERSAAGAVWRGQANCCKPQVLWMDTDVRQTSSCPASRTHPNIAAQSERGPGAMCT